MSCFSGVIGIIAFNLDNQYIRLWKELYVFLFFIISMLIRLPYIYKHNIYILFFLIFIFGSSYINSINFPSAVIFYQIKMDLPFILFIIAVLNTLLLLNKEIYKKIPFKISKLIIILGILNAFAMFFQRYFPSVFANLIGFQIGDWESDVGVRIVSAGNYLRSIGFFTYFVPAGTFMILCFIMLVESYPKKMFKKPTFYFLAVLFLISVIFSTYKTALLGMLFYLCLKTIGFFLRRYSTTYTFLFSFLVFFVFFYSTHFYKIYKIIAKFNESVAYNSIYLRAYYHLEILKEITSIKDALFGLGMGVHGLFGLEKTVYGIKSLPTDSTYIYLVSNYGYTTVFIFLGLLLYLIKYFFKHQLLDYFGCRYILLYVLCIEFFYNNFFANFPLNLIIALLSIITLVNIHHNKKEELQ